MSSPGRWPALADAAVSLVLFLYVVAAALLPLAHHDIVCHLKSSTHCTTCVVGASAESAGDTGSSALFELMDADLPAASAVFTFERLLPGPSAGRAPPSRL